MILLDTDTVTHFSYGNVNVLRKIEDVGDDEELAIAVITRNEILRGRAENLLKAANEVELRTAAGRFHRTEGMLSDFAVAGFDDESIENFGRLKEQKNFKEDGPGGHAHRLHRSGSRCPVGDEEHQGFQGRYRAPG